MKVRCYRVEPNDDGTFQVTADMMSGDGGYCGKEIKVSANSLDEVTDKIKEIAEKAKAMKKKQKGKKDKTMETFLDSGDSEY